MMKIHSTTYTVQYLSICLFITPICCIAVTMPIINQSTLDYILGTLT